MTIWLPVGMLENGIFLHSDLPAQEKVGRLEASGLKLYLVGTRFRPLDFDFVLTFVKELRLGIQLNLNNE